MRTTLLTDFSNVIEGSFEKAAKVKHRFCCWCFLFFLFSFFFSSFCVCEAKKRQEKEREERPIQKEDANKIVLYEFYFASRKTERCKNRPKKSQGKGLLFTSRAPGLFFFFCYLGKTK